MSKKDWLYYLLLTSSAILWGSSFIFTKQLLNVAEPVTIIFSRLLIAGILFLLICLLFFRKDMKIERQDIPTVFAFSCFEPFLYFICERPIVLPVVTHQWFPSLWPPFPLPQHFSPCFISKRISRGSTCLAYLCPSQVFSSCCFLPF